MSGGAAAPPGHRRAGAGPALAGVTGRAASAPVTSSPLLPAEPAGTGGARLRQLSGRGSARVAGPAEGAGGAAGLRARLRPRRGGTGRRRHRQRRPELSSGASVAPMRCRRPPGATKEGAGGPRAGGSVGSRGEERGRGPGLGAVKRGGARRPRAGGSGRSPAGGLGPSTAPAGLRGGGQRRCGCSRCPCSQGGDGLGVMAPWQRAASGAAAGKVRAPGPGLARPELGSKTDGKPPGRREVAAVSRWM